MTLNGEIPDSTSRGAAEIAKGLKGCWEGAEEEQSSGNVMTISLALSVTEHEDELTTG